MFGHAVLKDPIAYPDRKAAGAPDCVGRYTACGLERKAASFKAIYCIQKGFYCTARADFWVQNRVLNTVNAQ
jgi:hypothetical protein